MESAEKDGRTDAIDVIAEPIERDDVAPTDSLAAARSIVEEQRGKFFHPLSGACIVGLDWLLFSGNVASGGLMTAGVALGGFVLGGTSVALCQRYLSHDTLALSAAKGLVAGLVVGIPMPIAGTFVGGLVLSLSGVASLKNKLLPGNISK